MNRFKYFSVLFLILLIIGFSCKNYDTEQEDTLLDKNVTYRNLSQEFKDYWYAGEAEITSYKLQQARYGEIRNGHAVLIYVTEDFLPVEQVKADSQNPENISVLKLNATKKFNTGIYPYSIMQSTFYPISKVEHATKVSCSVQEWCGQTYIQLNNRDAFKINSHSYFQGEADKDYSIQKATLENELWAQLRIAPKKLPVGELEIIPSFEYISLKHKTLKTYKATATLTPTSYTIKYHGLNRTLTINFNEKAPYLVNGWTESFKSGSEILTTTATKLETIKSAYWNKNKNKDSFLRETLKFK